MKQYIRKLLCTALVVLLLLCIACTDGTGQDVPSDGTGTNSGEDMIVVETDGSGSNPQNTLLPEMPVQTEEPTEEPTPEPTPNPTRPPIEGDVSTGRFPAAETDEDADWSYQSDELRIAIKRCEDEDEDTPLVYYVADIWIRNISSFRMGFARGKYNTGWEDPEKFAEREHAILGFSGSFNKGLVIHNGVKTKGVEKSNAGFRSGIFVIYQDGSAKVINRAKKENFDYDKENKLHGGIRHALQFGPVLVQNGEINEKLNTYTRQPRIMFGYCEPGHYIAVAVDGRTKTSIGMTEQEMGELMLSLGCKDAMNLDGGYSAAMVFMGKTISTPAPRKEEDGTVAEGRNIVDMLLFAEYDADGNAPELSDVIPAKFRGE